MRSEQSSFLHTQRALMAGLALAAIAAVSLPASASAANTTAKATIMNKVSVNYKDAGGLNDYNADATTIVTVNLVKAGLNINGAPSGDAAPPALSCTSIATSYPSGSTINFLYALSAAANGSDDYKLSMAKTNHDVTSTVTWATVDYQGLNPVSAENPRTLGSAIPTRVVSDTVLEFPGGALEGFAANDLVVVQTTAGKRTYLVTAVSPGFAPVYSHVGNVEYTDVGTFSGGGNHPETKGTMTLGAWTDQTITLNGATVHFGNTPAPTFNSTNQATLNVPLGEMVLVTVDVKGNSTTQTNGTVDFTLTTTDSADGNSQPAPCTAGTFVAPTLSIKKQARNASTSGSFAATAVGIPGEILEYEITVKNTSGQASLVNVSDNVPSYTSLVTHTTYGNGTAGTIFAKVTDNASNTISLSTAVDNPESSGAQPLLPRITAFGDAAGTTAGSALKFWLGDTAGSAAGGKLPYCSDGSTISSAGVCSTGTAITTLTILYQVKIN